MKTKYFSVGFVVSVFCFLAVASARGQVEQEVTLSGKQIRQGPIDNNGTATVTDAQKPVTITTKTLLDSLAVDETLATNWFVKYPNKVPPNAKVEAVFLYRADFSGVAFRVVSGTNVVNVTNILSGYATGTNELESGRYTDTNRELRGPFNFTTDEEFTIAYDARAAGGGLWFNITGLATCSAIGGSSNARTEKFPETDSFSMIDGTGAGFDSNGTPFIVSGVTVTASGSGTANVVNGVILKKGLAAPEISTAAPAEPAVSTTGLDDGQILQTVALLSGVELKQNKYVDKKGVTTTAAPTRSTVSTGTLLLELAKDETRNGTWFAGFDNKVPGGAKLKAQFAGTYSSSVEFEVTHGTDAVVVTNILSAAPADTNGVQDIGYVGSDGPSAPPYFSIVLRRYALTYDARPAGGVMNFTVTGMGTADIVAGSVNKAGVYTVVEAFGMGYGMGGGVDASGTPILLSGVNLVADGKEQSEYAPGGGGKM